MLTHAAQEARPVVARPVLPFEPSEELGRLGRAERIVTEGPLAGPLSPDDPCPGGQVVDAPEALAAPLLPGVPGAPGDP